MDTYLYLVPAVFPEFLQMVGQVNVHLVIRDIEHHIALVGTVLYKFGRTVGIKDGVAFFLVFTEVMLARRADILDIGSHGATVVVMACKYLVEVTEDICRQFIFGGTGKCAIDAFMDIEVVKLTGVYLILNDFIQLLHKTSVFRKVRYDMEHETPLRVGKGVVFVNHQHIVVLVVDMAVAAYGFPVH